MDLYSRYVIFDSCWFIWNPCRAQAAFVVFYFANGFSAVCSACQRYLGAKWISRCLDIRFDFVKSMTVQSWGWDVVPANHRRLPHSNIEASPAFHCCGRRATMSTFSKVYITCKESCPRYWSVPVIHRRVNAGYNRYKEFEELNYCCTMPGLLVDHHCPLFCTLAKWRSVKNHEHAACMIWHGFIWLLGKLMLIDVNWC